MGEENKAPARFEIYRAADARDYGEANVLALGALSPTDAEGLAHFHSASAGDGQIVTLLYAGHGFSLSYAWFKSGYPLPLHSHGGDCLYHIVGGSLKLGHEVLGVGDGFFVGADVPYTYVAGAEGAEVLEFRSSEAIDIRFRQGAKAWAKAAATLAGNRGKWQDERPPREVAAKRDAA